MVPSPTKKGKSNDDATSKSGSNDDDDQGDDDNDQAKEASVHHKAPTDKRKRPTKAVQGKAIRPKKKTRIALTQTYESKNCDDQSQTDKSCPPTPSIGNMIERLRCTHDKAKTNKARLQRQSPPKTRAWSSEAVASAGQINVSPSNRTDFVSAILSDSPASFNGLLKSWAQGSACEDSPTRSFCNTFSSNACASTADAKTDDSSDGVNAESPSSSLDHFRAWTSTLPFHVDLASCRTFYKELEIRPPYGDYAIGAPPEDSSNQRWTVTMGDVVVLHWNTRAGSTHFEIPLERWKKPTKNFPFNVPWSGKWRCLRMLLKHVVTLTQSTCL
jgi:hypothetical protein